MVSILKTTRMTMAASHSGSAQPYMAGRKDHARLTAANLSFRRMSTIFPTCFLCQKFFLVQTMSRSGLLPGDKGLDLAAVEVTNKVRETCASCEVHPNSVRSLR